MDNETLLEMGKRIRELREHAKMSQLDLAISADVQPSAVSDYENGKRNPSLDKLKAIAKALYVTPDYLLGVDSDPDSQEPPPKPQNPVMDEVLDDVEFWKRQGMFPPSPEEKEFIKTNYHFRDSSGGNLDRLAVFYRETLPFMLTRVRNSGFLEKK